MPVWHEWGLVPFDGVVGFLSDLRASQGTVRVEFLRRLMPAMLGGLAAVLGVAMEFQCAGGVSGPAFFCCTLSLT